MAEVIAIPSGSAWQMPEPMPPCNVMLDLETWGTGNKPVIVSIGACKFSDDKILDSFHVGINPTSCQEHGLEIDADTVLWWMSEERREALDNWLALEKIDLGSALLGFQQWCLAEPGVAAIWGNGSTFDNIILRSAYAAAGMDYPVRHWADQCYRTVKNASDIKIVREGVHHNALDDAISQAKHLQAIWRSQDQTPLRNLLRKCEDQFAFYAENHRAKIDPTLNHGSEDPALGKAVVNEAFVIEIRQLLDAS